MSKNRLSALLGMLLLFMLNNMGMAQFPPPVGHPGTTAMYKDSSAFIGWANSCIDVRGYINITDTTKTYYGSNKATQGHDYWTNDSADGLTLSLGDGGYATLFFDPPIGNGPGPDFAVFENSFGDLFLELGFVEVSSDGIRFVRFPCVSLTETVSQIETFGTLDATKIHNFAGKYRFYYGTPFDLDDVKDSTGIDLDHIIYVRIIDAIGCIQDEFTTHDSQGNKVNDPWPTEFDTGGFDLDAIGVIHYGPQGIGEGFSGTTVNAYPNPASGQITFSSEMTGKIDYTVTDPAGKPILRGSFSKKTALPVTGLSQGMYIARFMFENGSSSARKIFIR
jgi:hypothetical protein